MWYKIVLLQSCLAFKLVRVFVSVFQEKTPLLRGVRQHLPENNILSHGPWWLPFRHAKEFGTHRYSPHGNPMPQHATLWDPEIQSPKPQKGTWLLILQTMLVSWGRWWEVVSNYCSSSYRQTAFSYILRMWVGLSPDKIQIDAGQRPPWGAFTSYCTLTQ